MEKEWQLVYTTNDTDVKAPYIQKMLESNGLHVVILNKKDSTYNFGEAEIYVLDFEKDTALELLKAIDSE